MLSEVRLKHLIHTNDAPEPDEIPWIQSQINDSDAAIVRLGAEIARIKAALAQLHIQRNAQSDRARSLRKVLSPIRVIPADVLGQIFAACWAASMVPYHNSWMKSSLKKEAPLQISQICSSWRAIVLNTPLLWSDLTFIGYIRQAKGNLRKLWIERSQAVPLSLTILAYSPDDSFDSIQPYFARTRALSTDINLSAFSSLAKSAVADDSFPQLRSLAIMCGSMKERNMDMITVFRSAHNLTHFTLERFKGDLAVFDLPWVRLTFLRLRNTQVSLSGLWRIISMCENLEELAILEYEEEGENLDPQNQLDYMVPILMPRLKKIVYHIQHANWIITAFPSWPMQRLIVPALEDFTVARRLPIGDLSWIDFREMQQRSSFALKRLELGYVRLLAEPAVALADLPSLTELTSHGALPFETAFFHALTPAPGDAAPLLPNLRVLRLTRSRAHALAAVEDVARMVEARAGARGVAPLRVLRMASLRGTWDAALVARLGRSIEAGLTVESVTYSQ